METIIEFLDHISSFFDELQVLGEEYEFVVIAASIALFGFYAWRRSKRPVWHPPIAEKEILFHTEDAISVSSMGFFALWMNRENSMSLSVTVTPQDVLIEPSLASKLFSWGKYEFFFPRKNILRIAEVSNWGKKGVTLEFRTATGETQKLILILKRSRQLVELLTRSPQTRSKPAAGSGRRPSPANCAAHPADKRYRT